MMLEALDVFVSGREDGRIYLPCECLMEIYSE